MSKHTGLTLERDAGGVWLGTCGCGATWTGPSDAAAADLFFTHQQDDEVPVDCLHDWRHRGWRLDYPDGSHEYDLYYCTKCLEHTEKKR